MLVGAAATALGFKQVPEVRHWLKRCAEEDLQQEGTK